MRVRWLLLFALATALFGSLGVSRQAHAAPSASMITAAAGCAEYPQASGATWKVCYPTPITSWNTSVVVWAHGYEPPGFAPTYQDTLTDGTPLAELVNGLGFAFITTTYPDNGLVVQQAKPDLIALLRSFKQNAPAPVSKSYLVGASMGGLIATQLAEETTGVFDGAMAVCALAGNFKRQITYWGDFNALYRSPTFFADVVASWSPLPGKTTNNSQWATYYQPTILAGISANPIAAEGLLKTSKAAIDPQDPATVVETIAGLAYFSFLSSEDAAERLGGNPFENRKTWYSGLATPAQNLELNKGVPRSAADSEALAAMAAYETNGRPRIPLVVMHTTRDPIVPVDQMLLYLLKSAGNAKVTPFLVSRYGHCTFTATEVQIAFLSLIAKTTLQAQPSSLASTTLIEGAAVAKIAADFAAAEAEQDPASFTQVRLPAVQR